MRSYVTKLVGYGLKGVRGEHNYHFTNRIQNVSDPRINSDSRVITAFMRNQRIQAVEENARDFYEYLKNGGVPGTPTHFYDASISSLEMYLDRPTHPLVFENILDFSPKAPNGTFDLILQTPDMVHTWRREPNLLDSLLGDVPEEQFLRTHILESLDLPDYPGYRFFDFVTREPIDSPQVITFMKMMERLKGLPIEIIEDPDRLAELRPKEYRFLQMSAESMLYGSYLNAFGRIRHAIPATIVAYVTWAELFTDPETVWDLQPYFYQWSN